jgi:2-desacetyl-2-hydroxyethyl bacteriochlorophyllide A dehydrogenase
MALKDQVDGLSLYFNSPGEVVLREEHIPPPGPGEVLVRSSLSAISAGTEMLLYRGQFPEHLPVDPVIGTLAGGFSYPIKYGYATVGEIVELGEGVDANQLGSKVFAFQPHASYFISDVNSLQIIPDGLAEADSVFLPNMETAVSLTMDGAPMIGERVVVLGQGIVGLLTTALLAQYPLQNLVTFDSYDLRRQRSLKLGSQASLNPEDERTLDQYLQLDKKEATSKGADLVYELSGAPEALNLAISMSGFEGRVVIGSFYGNKRAEVDLGGWFHRNRIKVTSSQVSNINPELSGRWDKSRRFEVAWEMLEQVKPSQLITHSFPIRDAAQAYHLLDANPGETIQVVFEY